ncbi:hypothetical protein [Seohaeicola zhoushanensis]|uniref:Uncharacterized protein n=1 Tax=Seohaeicola zhoushanensis TaxID=1569283 RepID=A0A8J3M866_9RHOB|nr:hypothetical protein [Seohaeicola zhoushanensis]GHF57639.1 hypothetical protein GCM10017056_31420 [Seohaeicola zhoushanensis]
MRPFLALLLLAACNTPSPHFSGLEATRVSVAGSVFDIRVRGDLAEALRVNAQYAPRFGPIRARAAFAMEQVSGCTVTEVSGDQALALGKLSCKDRPTRWSAPVAPVSYSCTDVGHWSSYRLGVTWQDFDCDPV